MGPKTEPCGTPDDTSSFEEERSHSAFYSSENLESSLPAAGAWQVFVSVFASAKHAALCLSIYLCKISPAAR